MAFTGSYSIAQNNGQPTTFVITDTSTGSDPSLTDRRITLTKADNTTLVPEGTTTSYIDWPIGDGPKTIDVLNRDYALIVTVDWISSSPLPASVYTVTEYFVFTANTKTFLFGLSTTQSSNPSIINDTTYFNNKAKMWTYLDDAQNAIDYGNDVYKAQLVLDSAYNMIINSNYYF